VPYVLVCFREGPNVDQHDAYAEAHNDFVTSLIRRNAVLLGGSFATPLADLDAAYVLRCASLDEARELVAGDPFFRENVFQPELVEWKLVGINPDAIDPSAILRPADV
jgi:uncharacterized protein YciI